jgi:hypothetical protein
LLQELCFETIEDGKCVQMLHVGSFDDEPASFQKMNQFSATAASAVSNISCVIQSGCRSIILYSKLALSVISAVFSIQ